LDAPVPGPSPDSIWFLYDPAEPPFPCIPPEAGFWYALERQMWDFHLLACLRDEVKPLFLRDPAGE